jgi:tripartite-type tricarboxylate transporter receptor subunit TctC
MEKNVMNGKALWNTRGKKTVQNRKPNRSGPAAQRALMIVCAIVGSAFLIGAMVAPVFAQSYPNKPIRFILPFTAGGTTDILGRIIGDPLSERLGQPVVLENRAGAGGNVGHDFVAKARPDGYTLVLGSLALSLAPSLYKKLNYDPIKDFAPITMVSQFPIVMLGHPNLPAKNAKEFVEYAKAKPGKLNWGSAGVGTLPHLAGELLNGLANNNMVHVTYKGSGQAVIGVMGGEVEMASVGIATAMPHLQGGGGKVKGILVTSNERSPLLPNLPTAKEVGINDFVLTNWFAILAPAGTPRDIVNRLSAEWIKIAAMPGVKEKMLNVGFEAISSTPEQCSEFVKAEVMRWAKVVKERNIPSVD